MSGEPSDFKLVEGGERVTRRGHTLTITQLSGQHALAIEWAWHCAQRSTHERKERPIMLGEVAKMLALKPLPTPESAPEAQVAHSVAFNEGRAVGKAPDGWAGLCRYDHQHAAEERTAWMNGFSAGRTERA